MGSYLTKHIIYRWQPAWFIYLLQKLCRPLNCFLLSIKLCPAVFYLKLLFWIVNTVPRDTIPSCNTQLLTALYYHPNSCFINSELFDNLLQLLVLGCTIIWGQQTLRDHHAFERRIKIKKDLIGLAAQINQSVLFRSLKIDLVRFNRRVSALITINMLSYALSLIPYKVAALL